MLREALPAYATQIFRHRPGSSPSPLPPARGLSPGGGGGGGGDGLLASRGSRPEDEPRYFSLSPMTADGGLWGSRTAEEGGQGEPYRGTADLILPGRRSLSGGGAGGRRGVGAMDAEVCFNLLSRAKAEARAEIAELRAEMAELAARAEAAHVRAEAEAAGAQAAVLAAVVRGRSEAERAAAASRAEVRLARLEADSLRTRLAQEEELGRTRLRANSAAMQALIDAAEAENARLREQLRQLQAAAATAAAAAAADEGAGGKGCRVA